MQRTNIYLTEQQSTALRERALAEGVSRAELIRRLLDRALAGGEQNLDEDLAALEGSFGVWSDRRIELDREDGERGRHLDRLAGA